MITDVITFEDTVAFGITFIVLLLVFFLTIRWVQKILHQFYRFK